MIKPGFIPDANFPMSDPIMDFFSWIFFGIYDRIQRWLFPPDPLSLYARMIERIEFEELMKEKGFTFS